MDFHDEVNVPATLMISLYSRMGSDALSLLGAVSAEDIAVSSAVSTAAGTSAGTSAGATTDSITDCYIKRNKTSEKISYLQLVHPV